MSKIQPIDNACQLVQNDINNLYRNDKAKAKVMTKALGDVERCVKGYSSREGFFGKIGGLFYRVWNAVKAIFGQSDWQKGRRGMKTLTEVATGIVSDKYPAFANRLNPPLESAIKEDADKILRFFVKNNQHSFYRELAPHCKQLFLEEEITGLFDYFTSQNKINDKMDELLGTELSHLNTKSNMEKQKRFNKEVAKLLQGSKIETIMKHVL